MDKIDSINIFIDKAKVFLCEYFRAKNVWNDVELTDIYPITYIDKSNVDVFDYKINALDYLGDLYEQILPQNVRKDYGQFFTKDSSLIDIMLDNIDLLSGKILEPSCGAGVFLVKVIQIIIEELKEKGFKSFEIIEYIQKNVYGNDIDAVALQISEINILACLMPLLIETIQYKQDFVMPKLNLTQQDFTDRKFIMNQYSVIIGNPPFVTMYGKRSRNMTEEKRAYYNTFDFVANKNGNNKFNMSMFFIENGLKSLKKCGRLVFILDISFFETAYIDLRKYLIQNFKINRIIKGIQAFEGVASGQIILDVSNDNMINSKVCFMDLEKDETVSLSQEYWNDEKNKYKILLPLNSYEESITKKITKYPTLEYYFPKKGLRTCCALTGKTEEFIVEENESSEHEIFPYLEGSKGITGKFEKPRSTKYIKYDYDLQIKLSDIFKQELEKQGVKNKKRVTLGDKEAYLSPKLFIRQSATELIATYTSEPFAANNSIYILTNKLNTIDEIDLLKYTCGILNSDLITFFCRVHKIIRMEKGKTPQIKISDLKKICINLDVTRKSEVISVVDELLNSPLDSELQNKLNNIVYELYNIQPDEISYIKSALRK